MFGFLFCIVICSITFLLEKWKKGFFVYVAQILHHMTVFSGLCCVAMQEEDKYDSEEIRLFLSYLLGRSAIALILNTLVIN